MTQFSEIFDKLIKENTESSKSSEEMMVQNTTSLEDMSFAKVEPGQFSSEERTDLENVDKNRAEQPHGQDCNCPECMNKKGEKDIDLVAKELLGVKSISLESVKEDYNNDSLEVFEQYHFTNIAGTEEPIYDYDNIGLENGLGSEYDVSNSLSATMTQLIDDLHIQWLDMNTPATSYHKSTNDMVRYFAWCGFENIDPAKGKSLWNTLVSNCNYEDEFKQLLYIDDTTKESRFLSAFNRIMMESDYEGVKQYNNDLRITANQVLRRLKAELDGVTGLHVDSDKDKNENTIFLVSGPDWDKQDMKLPKTLDVENVKLKLLSGKDGYRYVYVQEGTNSDYPLVK